jgi:phosphoserine phosphatase
LSIAACAHTSASFRPIPGFTPEGNTRLERFFAESKSKPGRKVAVFDGDGTTLGQAPSYLADECLYLFAQQRPERKPEVIERMRPVLNVSLPYVQDRVHFFSGLTVQELRDLGEACFQKHYADKVFEPMRQLIQVLQAQGFEVWIVTASPEALYQQFYAKAFGIPITQVIGVKTVVEGGVITDRIVEPVPQDKGKLQAIETFVQERPLLSGGNSRGDKEMIEYSADLKLIVNPDEFVAPDQTESMADYARKQGWLILRVRDVPAPDFPWVSHKVYGIRTNATHEAQ